MGRKGCLITGVLVGVIGFYLYQRMREQTGGAA
jgi:hypothetical protein